MWGLCRGLALRGLLHIMDTSQTPAPGAGVAAVSRAPRSRAVLGTPGQEWEGVASGWASLPAHVRRSGRAGANFLDSGNRCAGF